MFTNFGIPKSMATVVSITATATPIPNESSIVGPDPRQTKVILPKKKPLKWSTGVAPGDYGGPPTSTKLRKYWGGESEDPLTSYGFIWNKDFMPRMEKLVQDPPSDPTPTKVSLLFSNTVAFFGFRFSFFF